MPLVLEAAPQPFDKHIIRLSPLTVHAGANAVAGQHTGEGRTCEPWSMFEYFRPDSIVIDSRRARTRRVAQSSNDSEIHEATRHRI